MKKSNYKNIKEWIKSIFIAIFIIIIIIFMSLVIKYYFIDSVTILGISMQPTLENYQKVYISRNFMITGFNPERYKIVTFEEPLNNGTISNENSTAIYDYKTKIGFSLNFNFKSSECIKRIIGLPREHVKIENGKVYINNKELEENYLNSDTITSFGVLSDFIVPENTIFVLGDNREHSKDSREFGCIPFERIDGIAY